MGQAPVSLDGAATGFDWLDPRCRSHTAATTITVMTMNWLCQFWKDSNQNCDGDGAVG